ncbi:hypothetical protein BH11CYA1_BH11CYA1_32890 [soil metagenome]
MHDCPTCKVPLHGHEAVCPSCGTKQRIKMGSSKLFGGEQTQKPSINLMPFLAAGLIALGVAGYLLKDSWIAQLINRPPQVEDPIAKMTFLEARNVIESKVTEGVAATGGKTTFKWQRAGADVDKASEGPVEVEAQVELKDASERKAIIDPVKEYFDKAGITTLNVKDEKLHATWTYSVTKAAAPTE